ncbi:MAG: PfkB family carbohydrate kinase, partial [Gammaproteobacteria bacterium]
MQLKFDQGRILIVGDVMLDRYWRGAASRVSPEAPIPVVDVQAFDDRPGGAGNVALNIATLSPHVHLLGLLGDDENGAALKKIFNK